MSGVGRVDQTAVCVLAAGYGRAIETVARQLRTRIEAVRAQSADSDPVALAALIYDDVDTEQQLDLLFAGLSELTKQVLRGHGDWAAFDARAAEVAGVPREAAVLARVELTQIGWLTEAGVFPFVVRAWRRARLQATPEMVQRAADHAERAFHRLRCAGAGDVDARQALDHATRWSSAPDVAQWAAIVREEDLGDAACERCAAWAAIEQSRAAQWRGWEDQARRWLARAEAAAVSDRARFFVRFLRAIRAVPAGEADAAAQVEQLCADVPADEELHFAYQAKAVLAQQQRRDPRPHLIAGIGLAQRLDMPFREVHLRVLLALAEWPDGDKMLAELEVIDLSRVSLSDRDRWNLEWAWARARLAADDLAGAAEHARTILNAPSVAALGPGSPWAVVAVVERCAGNAELAHAALIQARRFLTLDDNGLIREWLERARTTRNYRPLPRLAFAHPSSAGWVSRDGTQFSVARTVVRLDRSPVAVALLRALATRPHNADALIAACWPDDASSYSSLKNRLHSAVRTLRRRGLGEHLVFDGAHYRLDGVDVVEV